MKKMLERKEMNELYFFKGMKKVAGANPDLRGDCTGLRGYCTGLSGDCTGLSGDLDNCKLTAKEREAKTDIQTLVPNEKE